MKFAAFFCLALTCIALSGFVRIGYSFRGPGFDRHAGVQTMASDTVVLAVTTGVIERGKGTAFMNHLQNVLGSMSGQEGLIGYAASKRLFGQRVWTQSVWAREEDLHQFLESEAHRAAVRSGGIPRSSVRSVVLHVPPAEIPVSWRRAQELLEAHP